MSSCCLRPKRGGQGHSRRKGQPARALLTAVAVGGSRLRLVVDGECGGR